VTTNRPGSDPKEKFQAMVWSIGTASTLMLMKLIVGVLTQSLSLIASAVDSIMDICTSTLNLVSLREAEKPADHEHEYGHGKIESLAGLLQSLFISGSGVYLIYEAIKRFMKGYEINHVPVAISVMVISIIFTLILTQRLKRVGRKSGSLILKTETLHYTMDYLMNGVVIVSLLLVRFTGQTIWDLLLALGIACYVLKEAIGIMRTSVDELIDRALPITENRLIQEIIVGFYPDVLGYHQLRTRKIGTKKFIDFHIEIRKEQKFRHAHEITERLIGKIKERFPDSDVTVHYDPEGEA